MQTIKSLQFSFVNYSLTPNKTNASKCCAGNDMKEIFCCESYIEFVNSMRIFVIVMFSIIFFVGLVGNSLVFLVLSLNKKMKSVNNVFILMLAIADLIFISFCIPLEVVDLVSSSWPLGPAMCKVSGYVFDVAGYLTVYTLVLMTLGRYLAVVYPLRSLRFRTQRNAWRSVLLVWAVILIANTPLLRYLDLYVNEANNKVCSIFKKQDIMLLYPTLGYALPLTANLIMAYLTWRRLRMPAPGETSGAHHQQNAKGKVSKMVVVMVTVFALCWFPLQVFAVTIYTKAFNVENYKTFFVFYICTRCFVYINSCVNPILYAFLCKSFRGAFLELTNCFHSATT